MHCSTEPRDRIYVKGYGVLSFAKIMINKYCQSVPVILKNYDRCHKNWFKESSFRQQVI